MMHQRDVQLRFGGSPRPAKKSGKIRPAFDTKSRLWSLWIGEPWIFRGQFFEPGETEERERGDGEPLKRHAPNLAAGTFESLSTSECSAGL